MTQKKEDQLVLMLRNLEKRIHEVELTLRVMREALAGPDDPNVPRPEYVEDNCPD